MAHSRILAPLRQVESLRRQFAQAAGLPFAGILSADHFQQILVECDVHFRERIFTPLITVTTFLTQVVDPDHSMRQAVARLIAHRAAQGLPVCSADPRAYGKARGRLPEGVLAKLTRHTGDDLMTAAPPQWRWHGRDVKLVDGTTLSMPDTPANQEAYPQTSSQKAGLGFPVLRAVVLFSLAVGSVIDAAMGPCKGKETGENALFRTLHHHLGKGDILLADRYYCGYSDVALVRQRDSDVVMHLHHRRHFDFRRGQRLGKDDHLVEWPKPKNRPAWMDETAFEKLPATMTMREVRVRVPHKKFRPRTIIVVTTLLDPREFPKKEIADLYRQRWHAELDLRSLKTFLQMDVLRCQTPAMVRKEVWVHLLAYNLIRKVMAQAAQVHEVSPRTISFKGTLQTLNAFSEMLRTCPIENLEQHCRSLLAAVAQHHVGNRPDRLEPRAKKRRAKPYDLLNKPRHQARKLEARSG